MAELKPTFTDVDGRKIVARLVDVNGFEYLSVEEIEDGGDSAKALLRLNMYDAKRLSQACEMFMQRSIARNFADLSGHLTPADRVDIFGEDEE